LAEQCHDFWVVESEGQVQRGLPSGARGECPVGACLEQEPHDVCESLLSCDVEGRKAVFVLASVNGATGCK